MLIHKDKQRLGELLMDIDLLSEDQVKQALRLQREQRIKFGDSVVKLGFLTKDDINWALSNQLNIPYLPDLKEKNIFDPAAATLLPYDFAIRQCAIILSQTTDAVNVVISDPLNSTAIEYISHLTGKNVNVSISDEQEIKNMIEVLYKNSNFVFMEHREEVSISRIKAEIESVLREIGAGFETGIYKNALCVFFHERAKKDVSIRLLYKETEVGEYFMDVLIDNSIGVLFPGKEIEDQHFNALLKLSKLQGLIVVQNTGELTLKSLG